MPDLTSLRRVLRAAPSLSKSPGVAGALASADADDRQAAVTGSLVEALSLSNQRKLAASTGASIHMTDREAQMADSVDPGRGAYGLSAGVLQGLQKVSERDGTPVEDLAKQFEGSDDAAEMYLREYGIDSGYIAPSERGFDPTDPFTYPGAAANVATAGLAEVADTPVIKQVLGGLDRVNDIKNTAFRLAGSDGLLGLAGVQLPGVAEDLIAGIPGGVFLTGAPGGELDEGELRRGMERNGYKSFGLLDKMAFFSHGEQVYRNLDDLREQFGERPVVDAQELNEAGGAENWISQAESEGERNRRTKLSMDDEFNSLAGKLEKRHYSPGRDIARAVGIDEDSSGFGVLSGSIDAVFTFATDPTLAAGKGVQAFKLSRRAIGGLTDKTGIIRQMTGGGQVERYWRGLHKTMLDVGSDDLRVAGNAQRMLRSSQYKQFQGLTDEVLGTSRFKTVREVDGKAEAVFGPGKKLESYDDFVDHIASTGALGRLGNGVAAVERSYMPGAISRFGAARLAVKGKLIDYRNPTKLIPADGDAVGARLLPNGQVEVGGAQAIGAAQRQASRASRLGWIERSYRRLTLEKLPSHQIDLTAPSAAEDVRKLATQFMNKGHADVLAASFRNATPAQRRVIMRGVLEQHFHAAGLPVTRKGREFMERYLSEFDDVARQVYSPVREASQMVDPATGELVQRALWPGQLSTTVALPRFDEVQTLAAKIVVGEHNFGLGRVLNNKVMDTVQGAQRVSWIANPANLQRNMGEDYLNSMIRGEYRELRRARHAVIGGRVGGRIAKREDRATAKALKHRSTILGREAKVDDLTADDVRGIAKATALSKLQGLHLKATDKFTTDAYRYEIEKLPEDELFPLVNAGRPQDMILNADAVHARQLTENGFVPVQVRFKPDSEFTGFDLVPTDGGKGAVAWAKNLHTRWESPELADATLDAALKSDRSGAVGELADFILSDESTRTWRELAERSVATKTGRLIGESEALGREAAENLADDLITDLRAMLSDKDGNKLDNLIAHLREEGAPTSEWIEANIPDALRPQHAVAANYIPVDPSLLSAPERVVDVVGAAAAKGYEWMVDRPLAAATRNPLYVAGKVRARRSLKGYADELARQGVDAELAEKYVDRLVSQHALQFLVARTDNHLVRSQLNVISRGFLNFERAQENFIFRWVKTLKEDPTRVRKAQLALEGGVDAGLIWKDEQGEWNFSYPGSGFLVRSLINTGAALGIPNMVTVPAVQNLSSKVTYLNPGLNGGILPTMTPIAATPISTMSAFFPEYSYEFEQLETAAKGEIGKRKGIWDTLIPSPIARLLKARDKSDQDSLFANAYRQAYAQLAAAGKTPGPGASPDERAKFASDLRAQVYSTVTVQSILGSAVPAPPGVIKVGSEGDEADPVWAASGYKYLKSEFRAMLEQHKDYGKALTLWAEKHPGKLAYTVGTTTVAGTGADAPATKAALDFMTANRDLFERYPSLMVYFLPGDQSGEFDLDAWTAQQSLGIREYKDFETYSRDIDVVGAERKYYRMRDRYEKYRAQQIADGVDDEQLDASEDGYQQWKQTFLKANPLLDAKFNDYGDQTLSAGQAAAELRQVVEANPESIPNIDGVRLMLDAFGKRQQVMADLKGNRTDDAVAARQSVQSSYDKYMTGLVAEYPSLEDLRNGLFAKAEDSY